MSARAIVFDLDGTLVASAADIRAALNSGLADIGAPPLDLPTVISFIGWGLPRLVEQASAHLGLPAEGLPALTRSVQDHYAAAEGNTMLFPQVREVLAQLSAAGHPLALCTNKPQLPTRKVLDKVGLGATFASVVCGDSLPTRKPDPAMLHLCLQELGVTDALYVGDSEIDAETAARAGLSFVLYTEGYRHCAVEEMPHAARFDDYAALPGIIARLLS